MAEVTLADLIARFAGAVQQEPLSPPVLAEQENCPDLERDLREALKKHQIDPGEVVRAQPDETLALAMRRNFFFLETYNEFFGRFEPQIRSWLMRWGVEYHRAFDLTQMLMLVCFQKRLHRYRPDLGPLRGYLRRAARNIWLQKDIRPRSPTFAPLPHALPQPGVDAEEEAARREMERRLGEVMAGLPPSQRAVLELRWQENLPHEEIAERLGITVKASEQLLFKARRALEERLGLALPPTNRGRPLHEPRSDSV